MKKLHIIYIPGLGDRGPNPQCQRTIVSTWRWYGVEPEFFHMNWGDNEPLQPKFERLLAHIDEAHADGKTVGLVGASAGGSVAINAYATRKDKISGVVLIAAKVNHPETVGESYKRKNPAFATSIIECQPSLKSLSSEDRKRILSRYALVDEVVRKQDSYVSGARNKRVFSFGHFLTIASQILFGAPSFLRFIRRQTR